MAVNFLVVFTEGHKYTRIAAFTSRIEEGIVLLPVQLLSLRILLLTYLTSEWTWIEPAFW